MVRDMTTWQHQLDNERAVRGDESEVVAVVPEDADLDREFHCGYKAAVRGLPVTIWTRERVYFPIVYDGQEWLGSAPRDPVAEPLEHQGRLLEDD